MSKYNRYGINMNTYNLLYEDYILPEDKSGDIHNLCAFHAIDKATMLKNQSILKDLNIEIEKNKYIYDDGNIKLFFFKLSDIFDDRESKNELYSTRRYGKCHTKSFEIVKKVYNTKLLTGYITIGDEKVLHSIVLYSGKEDYIMDWTRNILMPLNSYFKLTMFELLNVIDRKDILKDLENDSIITEVDLMTYLLFRNEYLKESNNKKILK